MIGALGCGPSVILASHYDQHCAKNSDCVVVEVGFPCGCAGAYDAVNVGAQQSIENDFANDAKSCPAEDQAAHCRPAPPTNHPVCDLGKCVVPASGEACTTNEGCTGTP